MALIPRGAYIRGGEGLIFGGNMVLVRRGLYLGGLYSGFYGMQGF